MIKIFEIGDYWFIKIENNYYPLASINYMKFGEDGVCLLSVSGNNEPYFLNKKESLKLRKFLEKQGNETWQTDEDED